VPIAFLIALLSFAVPSMLNRASRDAQSLVKDAAKSQTVLQPRSPLGVPSAADSAKAAAQERALAERQRNSELLEKQAVAEREADRKEAAWKNFFHRSDDCAIEENQTTVICANEYIRARREFDARWERGQF
jgi:hypothetical protein